MATCPIVILKVSVLMCITFSFIATHPTYGYGYGYNGYGYPSLGYDHAYGNNYGHVGYGNNYGHVGYGTYGYDTYPYSSYSSAYLGQGAYPYSVRPGYGGYQSMGYPGIGYYDHWK